MSSTSDSGERGTDTWSVIRYHDWDSKKGIETTLIEVLDSLGGSTEETILYDYIDVEALVEVLAPESRRGASEIRFEYEGYEIRVSRDGTVAVR